MEQASNHAYAGFGWTTYSSVSSECFWYGSFYANTPASAGSLDRYDNILHIVESQ
jgi:hypothetical protein